MSRAIGCIASTASRVRGWRYVARGAFALGDAYLSMQATERRLRAEGRSREEIRAELYLEARRARARAVAA